MSRVSLLMRSNNVRRIEALPNTLPSLVAWGEGADLGADASAIASWTNKTGSGLDPAQATGANQPTVTASAINGQKAARFTSASTQYLSFPAGALTAFGGVYGATLAFVYQPVTIAANHALFALAQSGAQTPPRLTMQMLFGTTAIRMQGRAPDATPYTADAASVVSAGIPILVVGTIDFVGQTVNVYVNGALAQTAAAGTSPFDSTTPLSMNIGANGLPAAPLDGYIGSYALWSAAYSRAQLDPVLRRWARVYGLTLS